MQDKGPGGLQKVSGGIYFQIQEQMFITHAHQNDAKRTKILATYTPLSIFKEIGLAEKLWISKPDDPELTKPGTFLTSVIMFWSVEGSLMLQKSRQGIG